MKTKNKMEPIPPVAHHITGSMFVKDIVIGMSDGLTVPFALAAGLSSIANSTNIVIVGGLAEIAAGSVAMGLGGYLAAKSDAEHYAVERATEERQLESIPESEFAEVEKVFLSYGPGKEQSSVAANVLRLNPAVWIDFMMRNESDLEKPDPHGQNSPRVFCRLTSPGFISVWLRQGSFHRNPTLPQCHSNGIDRRIAAAVAFALVRIISR